MKFEVFCQWPSLSSGSVDSGPSAAGTGWPSSLASWATCGSCSPSDWGCSSRKRNASGSETNKQSNTVKLGYNKLYGTFCSYDRDTVITVKVYVVK